MPSLVSGGATWQALRAMSTRVMSHVACTVVRPERVVLQCTEYCCTCKGKVLLLIDVPWRADEGTVVAQSVCDLADYLA